MRAHSKTKPVAKQMVNVPCFNDIVVKVNNLNSSFIFYSTGAWVLTPTIVAPAAVQGRGKLGSRRCDNMLRVQLKALNDYLPFMYRGSEATRAVCLTGVNSQGLVSAIITHA